MVVSSTRKVGAYEFRHVCEISPNRDQNGVVEALMPMGRYRNARNLPLNRYGQGPFCKFSIPANYRSSGVYGLLFGNEPGCRYLGECIHLSSRFNAGCGNISPRNCFKGGQETNCRLNHLIYRMAVAGERVSLWFYPTVEHKAVEKELLSGAAPAWNRR